MSDIADRADSEVERFAAEGVNEIVRALARKGCADCEACGQGIPTERQAAMPSATRCAGCQGMHEMKQRQFSRKR